MSKSKSTDPFEKTDRGLFVNNDNVEKLCVGGARGQFIGSVVNQQYVREIDKTNDPELKKNHAHLESFFPEIEEVEGESSGLLYKLRRGGTECCKDSKGIGKKKRIPLGEIEKLEAALERVEKEAKDPKTNGGAKSAINSLKLPDPSPRESPDFYRTWGPPWAKKLAVMWGASLPGKDLVPWREAIDVLKQRSRPDIVPKVIWFVLLPLLALMLTGAGAYGYQEAKRWHCREAVRNAQEMYVKLEAFSEKVKKNHGVATLAKQNADERTLGLCFVENDVSKTTRDEIFLPKIERFVNLSDSSNDPLCLEAKEIGQRAKLLMEGTISPRIDDIEKMKLNLCGIGQRLASLLSESRQLELRLKPMVEAANTADTPDEGRNILNYELKNLIAFEEKLSTARSLIDDHELRSPENKERLSSCSPAFDVDSIEKELEECEADLSDLKESFAKFNVSITPNDSGSEN